MESPDDIDALARRAGAELRRPAPADGPASVERTRRRRTVARAVGASVAGMVLIAGVSTAVVRNGQQPTAEPQSSEPQSSEPQSSEPSATVAALSEGVDPEALRSLLFPIDVDKPNTPPAVLVQQAEIVVDGRITAVMPIAADDRNPVISSRSNELVVEIAVDELIAGDSAALSDGTLRVVTQWGVDVTVEQIVDIIGLGQRVVMLASPFERYTDRVVVPELEGFILPDASGRPFNVWMDFFEAEWYEPRTMDELVDVLRDAASPSAPITTLPLETVTTIPPTTIPPTTVAPTTVASTTSSIRPGVAPVSADDAIVVQFGYPLLVKRGAELIPFTETPGFSEGVEFVSWIAEAFQSGGNVSVDPCGNVWLDEGIPLGQSMNWAVYTPGWKSSRPIHRLESAAPPAELAALLPADSVESMMIEQSPSAGVFRLSQYVGEVALSSGRIWSNAVVWAGYWREGDAEITILAGDPAVTDGSRQVFLSDPADLLGDGGYSEIVAEVVFNESGEWSDITLRVVNIVNGEELARVSCVR